jgi:hypothetical protein
MIKPSQTGCNPPEFKTKEGVGHVIDKTINIFKAACGPMLTRIKRQVYSRNISKYRNDVAR